MHADPEAGRTKERVLPRFLGVGAVNTAIDFSLYLALQTLGLPVVLANLVSTSCGLAFSYAANRRFTFQVHGSRRLREAGLFLLSTGFGLWVLQPLLIVFCAAELRAAAAPDPLVVALPKVIAIGVGVVWNYWFYSRLVFRTPLPPIALPATGSD